MTDAHPLHNRDGTLRSLARQMLADLDRSRETTPVRTATLEMLLERLSELLDDPRRETPTVQRSILTDAVVLPSAAPSSYFRPRAELEDC